MINIRSAIEALIFASPEPLTQSRIIEVLNNSGVEISADDVDLHINGLIEKWSGNQSAGFEIAKISGGYAFRSKADFADLIGVLLREKPQKLSGSIFEVLALIAYKQPITRLEIEEIRGVDCSASVRKLLGLNLIKILGKQEGLGRPLLYGTTKDFLQFLNINSLRDLPTLEQFQELEQNDPESKFRKNLDNSEITIADLFDESRNVAMFSEATAELSEAAINSLEQALNLAENVSKNIQTEKNNN